MSGRARFGIAPSVPGYDRGRTTQLSEAEQKGAVDRRRQTQTKRTGLHRKEKPRKTICKVLFNPNTAKFELDDSKQKTADGIQMFRDVKAEILKHPGFHEPALGMKRITMKVYKMQKKAYNATKIPSAAQKEARAKFFSMIARQKEQGYPSIKDRTPKGNLQRSNYKTLVSSKKRKEKSIAAAVARANKPRPAYKNEASRLQSSKNYADPDRYITQRYRGVDDEDMDDEYC
jgi:hypothetical protein